MIIILISLIKKNGVALIEFVDILMPHLLEGRENDSIAKRTKSKNRLQITKFPARLSQHKRVLRVIERV